MPFEITTTQTLEALEPHTKDTTNKSLEERAQLGLSIPDDFTIDVSYAKSEDIARGTTLDMDGHKGEIDVNTLAMFGEINTEFNIEQAIEYFNIGNSFFNGNEELVLRLVKNPVEMISAFESEFGRKTIKKFKSDLEEQTGRSYDEHIKYFVSMHKKIESTLLAIDPYYEQTIIDSNSFNVLRHELDHLAIKNSLIAQSTAELMKKKDKAYETGEDYEALCTQVLNRYYEFFTIVETRGLFFDNIKSGEWKSQDFDLVKANVYGEFHKKYIEGVFVEDFIDLFLDIHFERDEINQDTANYLMLFTEEQSGRLGHEIFYTYNPAKIQHSMIEQILYTELPEQKRQLSINARLCVDAIGTALEKGQAWKMKKADEQAENFYDYMRICQK